MSVSTLTAAVRSAPGVRRRSRPQQLRGPIARPQRLDAPGGRPAQPMAPALDRPVSLRARSSVRVAGPQPALQLTDRGLALVIGTFVALAVAAVVVVMVQFFQVSNAPLTQDAVSGVAVAALDGALISNR